MRDRPSSKCKFKVGDRVIVVRRYDIEFDGDWNNGWVYEMDATIGETFKVKRISMDDSRENNLIALSGVGYIYPDCVLQKVE